MDYSDTSFSEVAHRLACAEINKIVMYQNDGQFLEQLPEGIGDHKEKFGAENYRKDNSF